MKRISLFILTISILLFSCSDKAPTEPIEEKSEQVKSLNGQIVLELSNSNSSLPELDILSFNEQDDISSDNTFDIDVLDSETPQMVFAITNDDDLVLGATVMPGANSVVISETTTANTFILLNPLFMFANTNQTSEILEKTKNCATYSTLLQKVAQVIKQDPSNVYNNDKYPQLIELAAQVGYEILAQFEGLEKSNTQVSAIGSQAPIITPDYSNTGRVIFKNPNFVALSAEVLDLNTYEREKIFSLAPRPKVIKWKLGWPPVCITQPTSRSIDFPADNSYTILATKGFNFSLHPSEWIAYSKPNGRATLINTLLIARQAVRFFVGGMVVDAVELAANEVRVNSDQSMEKLKELKGNLKKNNIKGSAKNIYEFIKLNKYAFGEAIIGAGVAIKWNTLTKILDNISNFCPYLKPIGIAYQVANETIPIFTDLFIGQRTFNYQVKTDYSGDITEAYLLPSDNPLSPHVKLKTWTKGVIRKHYYIKVTCYTEDYTNKRYKYLITNKEYGNSVKLWETRIWTPTKTYEFYTDYMNIGEKAEYQFTVNKGTHELNVFAIDEDGNMSPASKTHKKRTIWW